MNAGRKKYSLVNKLSVDDLTQLLGSNLLIDKMPAMHGMQADGNWQKRVTVSDLDQVYPDGNNGYFTAEKGQTIFQAITLKTDGKFNSTFISFYEEGVGHHNVTPTVKEIGNNTYRISAQYLVANDGNYFMLDLNALSITGGTYYELTDPYVYLSQGVISPNLLTGSADWSGGDFVNFSDHVVLTDETYKGYKVVKCNQAWNSIQAYYLLKAGKTYTFSCYAKTDKAQNGGLYIWNRGEYPAISPSPAYNSHCSLTTDWKRYSITFTPNQDFYCHLRMEQNEMNTLYLAGYKLEEGQETPLEQVGGVIKHLLSVLHLERRCLAW